MPVLIDRERMLQLDTTAMEFIQEATGRNMMRGEFQPRTMREFSLFICACAQTDAEDIKDPLTLEIVLDSLFIHQFQEVIETMSKLLGKEDEDPNALAVYVPTEIAVIDRALVMAGIKTGEIFYDLGAGDGRALAVAARRGAIPYGEEHNPGRARLAKGLLTRQGVDESNLFEGNLQDAEFSNADVVFIYLSAEGNNVLLPKLEALKPGSRVVTHDFVMPAWMPLQVQTLEVRGKRSTIYLYEIGKSNVVHTAEEIAEAEQSAAVDQVTWDIDAFFKAMETDETATKQ